MRTRWIIRPVLALSCLAVVGAGRVQASDDFDFSSYARVPLRLSLRAPDGSPLPHARITVTDRWRPRARANSDGNVFGAALSDDNGDVNCVIVVPRGTGLVDVVVALPGYHGPYTLSRLRREWGAFAPASRTTRTLRQLNGFTLTLAP